MAAVAQEICPDATKRHIKDAFCGDYENQPGKSAGTVEETRAMVEDLRQHFQQRIAALQSEIVTAKNKQQQVQASGMLKLSKSIKNMSVREFNALYKTDLWSLLQPVSKKRDHIASETPAAKGIGSKALQTPSRILRHGELLL
jgi:hypothetical protein